jgi:RNA polymerase sigma-70 factor (ECF subfamily)
VQETLHRAWRTPAVLATHAFRTSFAGIVAKHIVVDEWRSARRRPEVVTDTYLEQAVSDTAQQTVDRQLVHAAIRTRGDVQQERAPHLRVLPLVL